MEKGHILWRRELRLRRRRKGLGCLQLLWNISPWPPQDIHAPRHLLEAAQVTRGLRGRCLAQLGQRGFLEEGASGEAGRGEERAREKGGVGTVCAGWKWARERLLGDWEGKDQREGAPG